MVMLIVETPGLKFLPEVEIQGLIFLEQIQAEATYPEHLVTDQTLAEVQEPTLQDILTG